MRVSRRVWGRALTRWALSGVIWAGVLLISWITYDRGLVLGGTAAWAGILHPVVFGLSAWPVLRRFMHGERWFTIPNAVLGLTYLSIGLGSVHFVLRYDWLPYAPLRRPGEVRAALLVALAGILAYRVGAEVPWFRGIVRRLPEIPSTPRWSWGVRAGVFIAIGMAVCSKLYLAATGSLGYVTGEGGIVNTGLWSILSYLSQVGLLALAGAYFYWFSGARLSKGDQIFLVIATGIMAALGLVSGMKHEFLFVFFGVVIAYMWTRGTRGDRSYNRGREVAFGLSLAAVMVVLFAVNPLYRRALHELQATESRIAQAPVATGIVLDKIFEGSGVGPLLATGAESVWGRLSIFPYHLAVVDQVPDTRPFRGFDRYPLIPPMTVVPRVVWPDKPVNSSGTDFQRQFISSAVVFSTTPTIYGWSYMELGVAGVVIVMLGLGGIAGVIEGYLPERHRDKLGAIILYTALFVTLAEIEADPFWLLGAIPKMLVIAGMVYGLFFLPTMLRPRAPRRWRSHGHA